MAQNTPIPRIMGRRFYNLPEAAPRIIPIDGMALGIKTYDLDNGYPQRMHSLINACSSAKMSVKLLSDFLVGQGFRDKQFFETIVNGKQLTADGLLRRIGWDKSEFRGFAIHINYNALYQIDTVNYIPFENARLGNDEKNPDKILLCREWYNNYRFGRYIFQRNIDIIDRYDPRPEVIEAQAIAAGGWDKYKGQVYYHSDDFESYPLASIDTVLEPVIAEIESDKTTTNNLRNNFQLKTIWVEKGEFADDTERDEYNEEVKKFVGSEGKSVAVVNSTAADGSDVPSLIPFESKLNDKIFQYTDEKVRRKIYRAFGQSAALHSDNATGGFNKDEIPSAYKMYNAKTQPDRNVLEEVFKKIFSQFKVPINPTNDYSIIPLDNLESLAVADVNKTVTDTNTNVDTNTTDTNTTGNDTQDN